MQRLKPKFESYQIEKDEKGQLVAVFHLMNENNYVATSQNGHVHAARLPDRKTVSYSREAISALRQIHTRMAQDDKEILDYAAADMDRKKQATPVKTAQEKPSKKPSWCNRIRSYLKL